MRRGKILFRVFTFFLIFLCTFLRLSAEEISIKTLPDKGKTYRIAEPDALEEIKERIKKVNWEKLKVELKKKIDAYLNPDFDLPYACENSTFSFYPLYTLPFDIKDANGNIIYPAGFTFNPLDYIPFPYVFVFFNGERKSEVNWLLSHREIVDSPLTFLAAVKGNIPWLSSLFKKPVYRFSLLMKKRFKVKKTLSIAYADGNKIVVEEIATSPCERGKGREKTEEIKLKIKTGGKEVKKIKKRRCLL